VLRAAVALGLLTAALAAPVATAAPGDVELVSVATSGAQGDGDSTAPSISHNGGVVAFQTTASTLAGGDGNGGLDVYVRRRCSAQTQRVSGGPGTSAGSRAAAVSGDGGTVAFESAAPELGGGVYDEIFLRRGSGPIVRVTHETGNGDDVGGTAPSLSADGSTVVFQSSNQQLIAGDDNGLSDVFSSRGGSIRRLSETGGGLGANGFSDQPALSADGRFVAYRSAATDLVSGSDQVATWDIFVTALAGGNERITRGLGGAQPNGHSEDPAISANGSVVAFQSSASNLVAGDTNGVDDVFVYDRNANRTERVSTGGTAHAFQPSVSGDGRYVAFASGDSALTPGDTDNSLDAFVHDRTTHTTTRVSERKGSPFGAGADAFAPAIAGDGCSVAFEVEAGGSLLTADSNGEADIYVAELPCGRAAAPRGGDPVAPGGDPVAPPAGADPIAQPPGTLASPVRGVVRIRTGRRFTRLRRATAIPEGAEIDTRRGVLRLTRGNATALVSKGRANVNGTTLSLTGRKLRVRAVRGTFRTRANGATVSGRKATWLTVARRRGVTVRSGASTVRLRRGDRYRVRSSQSRTAPQ
jgi:Tol biopolymer transport system component